MVHDFYGVCAAQHCGCYIQDVSFDDLTHSLFLVIVMLTKYNQKFV